MPLLSNVAVIFLSSIVVLIPNGKFLGCANIAFSEIYIYIYIYIYTLDFYNSQLMINITELIQIKIKIQVKY